MTTTAPTTESVTGLTVEAMIESLTGFDEIAIEQHFNGFSVYASGESQVARAMRALVFVHHRRDGLKDREAYQAAQNATFKELLGYFEEPDDELDPEDTPSGKDSTTSE